MFATFVIEISEHSLSICKVKISDALFDRLLEFTSFKVILTSTVVQASVKVGDVLG
jgi:CxxC motif-containing protein